MCFVWLRHGLSDHVCAETLLEYSLLATFNGYVKSRWYSASKHIRMKFLDASKYMYFQFPTRPLNIKGLWGELPGVVWGGVAPPA